MTLCEQPRNAAPKLRRSAGAGSSVSPPTWAARSDPTHRLYSQINTLFEHHPLHFGAGIFAVHGRDDPCFRCLHSPSSRNRSNTWSFFKRYRAIKTRTEIGTREFVPRLASANSSYSPATRTIAAIASTSLICTAMARACSARSRQCCGSLRLFGEGGAMPLSGGSMSL
jgi:hypothetical protein